jgi:hypothetical protein
MSEFDIFFIKSNGIGENFEKKLNIYDQNSQQ